MKNNGPWKEVQCAIIQAIRIRPSNRRRIPLIPSDNFVIKVAKSVATRMLLLESLRITCNKPRALKA
jgi:hypothetical protein